MTFWQISPESYEKVCGVVRHRDPSRYTEQRDTPPIIFCGRPDNQNLSEVVSWIEDFGAQARVEAAGSYVFFEFAEESDAVAFKLRWYAL